MNWKMQLLCLWCGPAMLFFFWLGFMHLAAFLSVWTGLLFVPACMIFWFKTGPFSWTGIVAFYIPVFIFFIWVAALTVPALLAVYRERATV